MSGPPPKPAHLRQRTNRKAGAGVIGLEAATAGPAPAIPNPGREGAPVAWHPLTLSWWAHVWSSPMAGQYLPTDIDGLGRVAMLVNDFYVLGRREDLAEIRLQEQRFGLSPLDRSRLQWEVTRGEEAERKRVPRQMPAKTGTDPRKVLRMAGRA